MGPRCFENKIEELEIYGRIKTIAEIGWNTEKSPGQLRILAVSQTPVKKIPANTGEKKSLEA